MKIHWHLIFRSSAMASYLIVFLPGETIPWLPMFAFLPISILAWSNVFKLFAFAALCGIFIRGMAAFVADEKFTWMRLFFETIAFVLMSLPIGYCIYHFPDAQFEGNAVWIQTGLFIVLYCLGLYFSWRFMKLKLENPIPADVPQRYRFTGRSWFYIVFYFFLFNFLSFSLFDFRRFDVDGLLIRLGFLLLSAFLLWYCWKSMRVIYFDNEYFYLRPYFIEQEERIPLSNLVKIEITTTSGKYRNVLYRFYYKDPNGEIKDAVIIRNFANNNLDKFLKAKGVDLNEVYEGRFF